VPEEQTKVVQAEAADYLSRSRKQRVAPWDIAFFDPPYATDYLQVLKLFGDPKGKLLSEEGLLIVEHHHKNGLPEELGSIIRSRILKQGDSALSFFSMKR
jgi:16S rRNA G966 N2-methylase RsmD